MNGEHLPDAGVVVADSGFGVMSGIDVAHSGLGPADEVGVAENRPGLLGARNEGRPERAQSSIPRGSAGGSYWTDFPSPHHVAEGQQRDEKRSRQGNRREAPESWRRFDVPAPLRNRKLRACGTWIRRPVFE